MSTSTSLFRSRVAQALVAGVMLLSLLLAACAPPIADAEGRGPGDVGDPTNGSASHEGIDIAEIEILMMESFPVQVAVLVRGHLRDGCTEIDEILQTFDAETNTFSVAITTVRDADALCTQALVPFEEPVSLDVLGLPAGTYTVKVNGVIDTFTLDVDNVLDLEEDEIGPQLPLVPSDEDVIRGVADVEEVSVRVPDAVPSQVAVVARGHLRDGCTEIDEIRQRFDAAADTFYVDIATTRPADAMCTLALVPFEEQIALDVRGLAAGTYTVDVNGVTSTFTLDVDAAPPADEDADASQDPGAAPDEALTYGTAEIEAIDIRIMESDPVQVAAVARGYLGDGCTEVDEIRQRFDAAADTFYVEITTVRPTEAMCIMILQGLEERVTLDVEGLSAGTYTVDVNGVTGQFTING